MKTYRAAVIGCGMIGSAFANDPLVKGVYTHAGAYAASPRVTFSAVCDSDQERAERCARRWTTPKAYHRLDDFLRDGGAEIVSVCTPDHTHAGILQTLLAHDATRAILAEKPLALSPDEARPLVELARRRGVLLAVNYSRRHAPGHRQVAAFLRSGGLGPIQNVTGRYTKGIWHNGTHWLDLARWFFGDISEVQAFPNRIPSERDPTLDARLVFHDGTPAWLSGCDSSAFSIFEMDIVGRDGRIRLVDSGHQIETSAVQDSPRYSGYRSLHQINASSGGLDSCLAHAVDDLISALDHGGTPACTGEDGLAVLKICSALERSLRSGRPERL